MILTNIAYGLGLKESIGIITLSMIVETATHSDAAKGVFIVFMWHRVETISHVGIPICEIHHLHLIKPEELTILLPHPGPEGKASGMNFRIYIV